MRQIGFRAACGSALNLARSLRQRPARSMALVLWSAVLLSGCRDRDSDADACRAMRDAVRNGRLPATGVCIDYPRDGTVFPPDGIAPTFRWRATGGAPADARWVICVSLAGAPDRIVAAAAQPVWRPDAATWSVIKVHSVRTNATVTVAAFSPGAPRVFRASASIALHTAEEPVEAPVMYRDVPLPFIYAVKNPDTIRWRLLDVQAESAPPTVLEGLPVCGNCHSFSADGKTLGMDVDYANDKGSYVITEVAPKTTLSRDKIVTWSDFKRNEGDKTFGLLSRVSPNGRYVVSTVKDRSVFVPRSDLSYSQLFFPIKGILAVYDREAGAFAALPGADDPEYVQSNPEWSPDGRWIYFCRARAAQIPEADDKKDVLITEHLARHFTAPEARFRFDIYRVPFNEGRGGEATPVAGASGNDKSNFFPKLSPDGQWLVFCRAESFMLLQPDSRLYIVPAAGGAARLMTCNTDSMNSWHSWSPNGRWLVFSSKACGPYTQLYLAHVAPDGSDAPAVLLERSVLPERTCNIPEFVNIARGQTFGMREDFLDSLNFRRQGQILLLSGDFEKSIAYFEKALKLDAGNDEARLRLAVAYSQTRRLAESDAQFATLLERLDARPAERARILYEIHGHMAVNCRHRNDAEGAVRHYRKCLELRPDDVEVRLLLGLLHASRGKAVEAESLLREAIGLAPGNAPAHLWLGMILADAGRPEDARAEWRKALALSPDSKEDWSLVAARLTPEQDVRRELMAFLDRFKRVWPSSPDAHVLQAKLHLDAGEKADAASELNAALRKDPSLTWIPAKIAEFGR